MSLDDMKDRAKRGMAIWVLTQSRRVLRYSKKIDDKAIVLWCVEGDKQWHRAVGLQKR